MNIKTPNDILALVEDVRKEIGISERELSRRAGKSHSLYGWWKKHAHTTTVKTALDYLGALGLKLKIEKENKDGK